MKRLLRGVINFEDGKISDENLSVNFQRLLASGIEWARPEDEKILGFVKAFFENNLELPTAQTVLDYFTRADDIEVQERLGDIRAAEVYSRTNFAHLLKQLGEDQNRVKMLALVKEVSEITSKGIVIQQGREKKKLQGVKDAALYFASHVNDLIPPEHSTQTRGDIRKDSKAAWDEYAKAKHNKDKVWGKFTGIEEIDKICHGLKRGEMWVHAAFAGELKTTFSINWCYNLVTRYRTNVFYCSFEMPYEQLRRMILVRHSANPRFTTQGKKPLDYRKVRDGELTPEEEAFYQEVLQDWDENPEYCRFHIWCPDRDVSITDVRIETELLHKQIDVGFLVLDHGGLMESSRKHRDYTIELNSVLRDAKKLALFFNHGEGLPVLMLFQLNREGKDAADKADGKYKIRALSYANECLAEGTLVRTSRGLVPIEEVEPGLDTVYSSTGWKDVRHRFEHGIRHTVVVRTNEGFEVVCTPEHLFQTVGENGLEWVQAKDLQGRYILSDLYGSQNDATSLAVGAFLDCLDALDDKDVKLLQRLLRCRPQQVVTITDGPDVPVFDLEVSGDHEYFTGGFLTHNCERSADTITTTYLNDNHRENGTSMCCCLKNRDNPLFKPFLLGVDFDTRRIYRLSPDSLAGNDMGTDDILDSIMGKV